MKQTTKARLKRFDKVKINKETDIYHGRYGVLITIGKSPFPYRVCFSIDGWLNTICGIYQESELIRK